MKESLVDFIKKTGAKRNFTSKEISEEVLRKVIDAGVWGLSILGIQPWCFVVIRSEDVITKIADICSEKSENFNDSGKIILRTTAKTLRKTRILVAVYNNNELQRRVGKYRDKDILERAWMAELLAIGGALQNMFLTANAEGLSAVWVDSPAFFAGEVNKVLGEDGNLVAFLALGYSEASAHRSKRRPFKEQVKIV